MNRKQTLNALTNIAERFAKEYNLTILTSNDITFDLWDNIPNTTPLSEIISKSLEESGEKVIHLVGTSNDNLTVEDMKKLAIDIDDNSIVSKAFKTASL